MEDDGESKKGMDVGEVSKEIKANKVKVQRGLYVCLLRFL